ncbi:glycosyl transferase [Candidatus Marinamargulisbacteria bacterium SCGC AG-343-D04]|nr:glycosyl transferase [Candidatus Marinamargulisbacteria bacterium SCGC AG-343-D04]
MNLSIIIPCYNEINTLETVIKRVRQYAPNCELIIVDDGSSDGSKECLTRLQSTYRLILFFHSQNQGKGASLQTGFKHASKDIILIQDADLEYHPKDYAALIYPIQHGDADVIFGSRFLEKSIWPSRHIFKWANYLLTWLSNKFTGLALTDMETCYKVFKRDIIQSIQLKEKGFGIEPEITAKLAKRNLNIKEVPISYVPRDSNSGKKIGFKDGLWAIWCIIYYGMSSNSNT